MSLNIGYEFKQYFYIYIPCFYNHFPSIKGRSIQIGDDEVRIAMTRWPRCDSAGHRRRASLKRVRQLSGLNLVMAFRTWQSWATGGG